MSYVSLGEAKAQCSVDSDSHDHDDRLARLIAAAEAWASHYLNRPLVDLELSPPSSPPVIPEDVKSGILLHVELEFDRDVQNAEMLLKSAERLLWPHRIGLQV